MMNSSRRKRSKKAAAGAVLLAVMLATAACGGANGNKPAAGNDQPGNVEESPIVTDLPEESGVLDPDVSVPEPTAEPTATADNESPTEAPADQVKVNEGIYSGLIDSHSIEIETAAGAIPLQITDEFKSQLEALPDDAKVKFEYTEKSIEDDATVKQNWLVKIEEVK